MSAIFEEFCFFQRFVLHVALKKRRFFGPRHTPSPDSFLHRFFMIFETILAPKSLQNGFREGLRKEYNFWYLILTIFDDFGLPRGPPNEAKSVKKTRRVGPRSAPFPDCCCECRRKAFWGPKCTPNHSKCILNHSTSTQNASEIIQNLSKFDRKLINITQHLCLEASNLPWLPRLG